MNQAEKVWENVDWSLSDVTIANDLKVDVKTVVVKRAIWTRAITKEETVKALLGSATTDWDGRKNLGSD